jgi:hypothetical protein
VTPEQARGAEDLRRHVQELLDRWYPGTAVTVDWTGQVYLVQLTRGFRLAPPIWVAAHRLAEPAERITLHGEVIAQAWRLAAGVDL